MVPLLHPYKTTGKTVALTRWTFISKVLSLLFNMLSRFVIAFLPRSKYLWISWLQAPSSVILELTKIKSVTVSIVFPSICHEVIRPDSMRFSFLFLFLFFWYWILASFFTLLIHFHQEALQFLFAFCHKDGVICISEVIDISPRNLDSSLCSSSLDFAWCTLHIS